MGPGLREQVSEEAGAEATASLRPRPRQWHVIAGHVPPVRPSAHPRLSSGDAEGTSHRARVGSFRASSPDPPPSPTRRPRWARAPR